MSFLKAIKDAVRPSEGKILTIKAPLTGQLIPLGEVEDPTFAQKLLGDGFAIKPTSGVLSSPVDGKVIQVFRTGHAIGLLTNDGLEILIHIGIDTVKMNGEGFTPSVKVDQNVKVGDKLLEFDIEKIKAKGKSITSPIIFTNMEKIAGLNLIAQGNVSSGSDVLRVELSK